MPSIDSVQGPARLRVLLVGDLRGLRLRSPNLLSLKDLPDRQGPARSCGLSTISDRASQATITSAARFFPRHPTYQIRAIG
jgi:hypothetical protein